METILLEAKGDALMEIHDFTKAIECYKVSIISNVLLFKRKDDLKTSKMFKKLASALEHRPMLSEDEQRHQTHYSKMSVDLYIQAYKSPDFLSTALLDFKIQHHHS